MFSFNFSAHIKLVCKPMGHADDKKPIQQCFFFSFFFSDEFYVHIRVSTEQNIEQALNIFLFTYPKPFELQNVAENEYFQTPVHEPSLRRKLIGPKYFSLRA